MSYFGQIKIIDYLNNQAEVTPYGELHVTNPVRIAGGIFDDGQLDTSFYTVTNTNGGTTTVTNAVATLATNTTANGATKLTTAQRARFVAGTINRFYARIYLGDAGTANNVRRWGMLNAAGTDGFYFKLNNTTLSACTLKGGVETINAITTTATLTNMNLYEIDYSQGQINFIINEVVALALLPVLPATNAIQLFGFADNTNSASSTTNVLLNAVQMTVIRFGRVSTQVITSHITTAATTVMKYGPGLLQRVTIGNPASSTSIITLYDNTAGSGTVITAIQGPAQANPVTLEYGLVFSTGLTAVSTGTWDASVIFE